ncbi:unnamed protein product [Pleuronectes platessa]|uniref:Uncharacterized protein n=1 Tax=Pleuronectes platessa TaxID=8262 RepID=A0A9N7U4I1_PLEPL|nr:unnamed protein product [Pleuronectes platessa]
MRMKSGGFSDQTLQLSERRPPASGKVKSSSPGVGGRPCGVALLQVVLVISWVTEACSDQEDCGTGMVFWPSLFGLTLRGQWRGALPAAFSSSSLWSLLCSNSSGCKPAAEPLSKDASLRRGTGSKVALQFGGRQAVTDSRLRWRSEVSERRTDGVRGAACGFPLPLPPAPPPVSPDLFEFGAASITQQVYLLVLGVSPPEGGASEFHRRGTSRFTLRTSQLNTMLLLRTFIL